MSGIKRLGLNVQYPTMNIYELARQQQQEADERRNQTRILQITITKKPKNFSEKLEFSIKTNLPETETVDFSIMDSDSLWNNTPNREDTELLKGRLRLNQKTHTVQFTEDMQKKAFKDTEFYAAECYIKIYHLKSGNSFSEVFDVDEYDFRKKEPASVVKKEMTNQCDKKLTTYDLIKMGISSSKASEYLDAINSTFEEYNISTCLRKISFFGQVLSETEAFAIARENGVADSDYKGFKGRGCIQLTWKENYVGYEEYKKKTDSTADFTSSTENKDKLTSLPGYIDSGGWFWSEKTKLNDDADRNDFIYIAYRVNGGFNHFDKRVDYYKKAAQALCKNLENPIFDFRKSLCYNDKKACFAWGLWHDPISKESSYHGVKRDAKQALLGYQRFVDLFLKAGKPVLFGKDKKWYGYKNNEVYSHIIERIKLLSK